MATIQFTATHGGDGVIRIPADVQIPVGVVDVFVTPKGDSPKDESPQLRTLIDQLANAAEQLGVDTSDLPSDLAQNHDHYLHGLPKGIDDE